MKRWCAVLSCLAYCGLLACAADEPVKVVIGPAKAKPQMKIEGEYKARIAGVNAPPRTIAAQVVARGNDQFVVSIFEGGFPGEGWDGKTKQEATAKAENGRVTFAGKAWSGTIADGVLTLNEEKSTTQLKRIERKSKTPGEKPR